jgi:hypothetical protein
MLLICALKALKIQIVKIKIEQPLKQKMASNIEERKTYKETLNEL